MSATRVRVQPLYGAGGPGVPYTWHVVDEATRAERLTSVAVDLAAAWKAGMEAAKFLRERDAARDEPWLLA